MNDSLEKNKKFFDNIAYRYDKSFGNWIIKTQKKSLDIINIKNNSRVLDVGCGTGSLLALLEKSGKRLELHGIDISKKMINIARKKVKRSNLRLMSVDRMSFKNNYFNYIISVDAFHHYPSPERAVKIFKDKLANNGMLAIIDLDFGFFNYLFRYIEPGNNGSSKGLINRLMIKNKFVDIKRMRVGLFTYLTIGMKNG